MNKAVLEVPITNHYFKHSKYKLPIDTSQINQRLLPLLYREVLLDHRSICQFFDDHHIVYVHPDIQVRPSSHLLKASAEWLIKRAARRALLIGAAGGSLGYAGIPFEQASYGLHMLRLGQRLMALYGQDPQSEHNEHILLKALSKVFHFELQSYHLPKELNELKYFIDQIKEPHLISSPKTTKFLLKTAGRFLLSRHFKRLVPTIGVTFGAIESNRALYNHGNQLHEIIFTELRPRFSSEQAEVAIEINRT